MSCFMVSERTLGRILYHVARSKKLQELVDVSQHVLGPGRLPSWKEDTPWQCAVDAMQTMNIAAMRSRYDTQVEEWELELAPVGAVMRNMALDVVVYKALDCYLYQCFEQDVKNCPLYMWFIGYRAALASKIVQALPAYENAPWE